MFRLSHRHSSSSRTSLTHWLLNHMISWIGFCNLKNFKVRDLPVSTILILVAKPRIVNLGLHNPIYLLWNCSEMTLGLYPWIYTKLATISNIAYSNKFTYRSALSRNRTKWLITVSFKISKTYLCLFIKRILILDFRDAGLGKTSCEPASIIQTNCSKAKNSTQMPHVNQRRVKQWSFTGDSRQQVFDHPQQAESVECPESEHDSSDNSSIEEMAGRRKSAGFSKRSRRQSILRRWWCSHHCWITRWPPEHIKPWFFQWRIQVELLDIYLRDSLHCIDWWHNHGWWCWSLSSWILSSIHRENSFCDAWNSYWFRSWSWWYILLAKTDRQTGILLGSNRI